MKAGWKAVKIGQISDIAYGYTEKASFDEIGPKFLRITDIQDGGVNWATVPYCQVSPKEHQRHRLYSGDIVFARTGATTGKSYLITDPPNAVCASYLIRLRLKGSDALPEFVQLFFQTSAYWDAVEAGTSGSAQGGFNASKLAGLSIPLPPLDEQRWIVAELDKAFAGIATVTANAQKNLTNARALFDSYLQTILIRRGDGWTDQSVGSVADTALGKMLDKRKNKGSPQPYLRNINVRWFEFDLSDLLQMRFEKVEASRYSVKQGDVVICEGGYPGRAAIWKHDDPIYYQKALHRVRFADSAMANWFVYILYHADAVGDLKSHFTGAGIQHFTGQALKKFKIPVPPSRQLPALVAGIDLVFEKTRLAAAKYEAKLAALTELKQTLLQKAFAGGLT